MIYRSRAPLRLGLAGGGTDVSPYSDVYGGAILNATINMYAYVTIEPKNRCGIIFNAVDTKETINLQSEDFLPMDGKCALFKGVYNRIIKDFIKKPLSFEITTYVDVPFGSGLGSSSTVVVAILSAFVEWLQLPLGEYDIAHLSYEIERKDLSMIGGKQDQYAATFGGFNFMEFYKNDKVIVNPLRIKKEYLNELQLRILLYYTGTSRVSSDIIKSQIKNVEKEKKESLSAMHNLKKQAILMKESLLKGKLDEIGEILNFGWQQKKKMAEDITNPAVDEIYETAKKAGATGGKISGAGGGGFMMLYCPKNTRYRVIDALRKFGGEFRRYQFTKYGYETWRCE